MNFIKGFIAGAACGYAYATRVSEEQRKQTMDRVVGTVRERTKPLAEAVSENARSVTDRATHRAAQAVDDAGTAANEAMSDQSGSSSAGSTSTGSSSST